MPEETVLELHAVTKRFGSERLGWTMAVEGLSFAIRAGEVFTLLGPSGCGKTTTLRIVAGLEQPDAGRLVLRGRTIADGDRGIFLAAERRNMGMVFQSYAIWPHFTVFENVAFPLRLRHRPASEVRRRVAETLEMVGLGGLASRPSTMLSGGQQQRVALARALVYEPDILLLDEPLSNLDAKMREHMRIELRQIQRRAGITVLLVTHDQVEAMTLSDRIAVIQQGRLHQIAAPHEMYEHPATPFVRDFLGRSVVLQGVVRSASGARLVHLSDWPGEGGGILSFTPGGLDGVAEGATVAVAFRPEDLRLQGPGAEGCNRLPAIVRECVYLGERMDYVVEAGGQTLPVSASRHERFAEGSRCQLWLDTSSATVWPLTPAAPGRDRAAAAGGDRSNGSRQADRR